MRQLFLSLLLLAAAAFSEARPFGAAPVALLRSQQHDKEVVSAPFLLTIRGGHGSTVRGEEDDNLDLDVSSEDVDESESDEEEAAAVAANKLKAATVKAAEKTQSKHTATAKAAVNAGLVATKKTPAKKKKSRRLRLPYIIGACLNPFTLIQMTKAYFASLINFDYLKKEPSQDLRSALEEKAKRTGGGGSKGKRKMRPGQAKTLSDLPQLNT